MSYPNLKLQIHQDQLTWFLDLLLDERELFQLSASTGIVADVDKLYALSRRELLVNLTDAFLGVVADAQSPVENSDAHAPKPEIDNGDPSIEALATQFLSEKAEAAISRVGYMELSEIETFFKTSDMLIEAGDFGEVVWALLTDERTAVAEHGYKLLNTTYESINVAHTNGYEAPISNEQLEAIAEQAAENLEAATQQSEHQARKIEQLEQQLAAFEQQLAASKADYVSLEKKHNRLDQQRAFLLEENKGLKTNAETHHGNEKRLKELEQENSVLREQVARYTEDTAALQQLANERETLLIEKERLTEQLTEYEQIKSAKETFTTDLKLVEEAIYKGHQGLEDFQTSLDSHFDALENSHQAARTALDQIRQTLAYLDTQQVSERDTPQGITSEQPRVGVFVDVQNMFYAAKDRFGGKVDYIKLLDLIVGPRHLMVAYAYVVQIPEIPQANFLSLLEHNGYTIKSKDLRLRGDGSAKGDWDVGIAVDVVSMLGSLDVVILASGDGDFCPLAELIKQQNKRVEVVAFEHNTSMDLQQVADQFFPIGDELLFS